MGFEEVADRVWVARHAWYDVTTTLVAGASGLVLVDTHASHRAALALLDDVRSLGVGAVTAVVNTHAHHDHVLGNAAVREVHGAVPIHAHEEAAATTAATCAAAVEAFRPGGADAEDPHAADVLATAVLPADEVFSSARVLDLGDRLVELVHPGRGHTAGDVVVRVPDADVLVAGDLVEEAGGAVPAFGDDCWPLEWPSTLDVVLGLTTPRTVVVPGHGALVDRDFVEEQRNAVAAVAETVRDLASRGVHPDDALGAAAWPYPPDALTHAVGRGFAHLPRGARRLPLA